MSKRMTTDEFIGKAVKVHGERYDYSKSLYVRAIDKIIVTCVTHGDFSVTPNKHLMGRNCPKCADIKRHMASTRTQNMFLIEARNIHGDRFDYSLSVYKRSHDKMIITCKIHGDFKQTPASHLQGVGCAKCGYELTAWNKTAYINCSKKNGSSCVYLIMCFNASECFYKVGITSTDINYRFKKSKMPYDYEVLSSITHGASLDWEDEKKIHKMLRSFKYIPNIPFGGMTECFSELTSEVKEFFGVN